MSNIVITGANRGIGLALVKTYLQRGANVFAACRKRSSELAATKAEIIENVDVTRTDAGAVLASALKDTPIDILINNAGVFLHEQFGEIDYGTVLKQFEVNAIGPLRITEALANNLREGGKVGLVTSRMGSIADNTSGGYFGYRMSKAALNAAGMSLAKELAKKSVAVAILHPGFVKTEMVSFAGDVTPEAAAQGLVSRLDALSLNNSGTFWHANGEVLPW